MDLTTGGLTKPPLSPRCIERLRRGRFDGVATWLMGTLMGLKWGCTPAVQAALDGFQGEKVDSLFLRALQLFYGYGVKKNKEEAFRMFSEGVKRGDPSGRCHGCLGKCLYDYGYGTEENLDKAIQMYRAGVALGDPYAQRHLGYCYQHGMGVPKDIDEARRLYTLSHCQGYASATYNLGWMSDDNIPLSVALFKEASARGVGNATDELKDMQKEDQSCVVPFGCWSPQHYVHKWVSDSMHCEMMCLLMAMRRPDGLVNALPKLVMHRICFYIACRPEEYIPPSAEAMMLAKLDRRGWEMEGRVGTIQKSIQKIEESAEIIPQIAQQLLSLQQQMAAVMELLNSQPVDGQHRMRAPKRTRVEPLDDSPKE